LQMRISGIRTGYSSGAFVFIDVKVTPHAKRQAIKLEAGILKVKVVSRADRGKANEELIEYLSEVLGVKKGDIRIVKGERDTRKVLSLPVEKTVIDSLFHGKGP
jgi:uncharacterized protein